MVLGRLGDRDPFFGSSTPSFTQAPRWPSLAPRPPPRPETPPRTRGHVAPVPTLPVDHGVGVRISGHEGQLGQPAALVPQHQRHGWALSKGREREVSTAPQNGAGVRVGGLAVAGSRFSLLSPRPALPSRISNEY